MTQSVSASSIPVMDTGSLMLTGDDPTHPRILLFRHLFCHPWRERVAFQESGHSLHRHSMGTAAVGTGADSYCMSRHGPWAAVGRGKSGVRSPLERGNVSYRSQAASSCVRSWFWPSLSRETGLSSFFCSAVWVLL